MQVCIPSNLTFPGTCVDVETAGKALPFDGVYVNYKKTGLVPDSFQKIAAGETVTIAVNAAKSYKLKGIKQAKVSAIQSFHYATGDEAPTALEGLSFCADQTTSSVEVTPDQNIVAEYAILSRSNILRELTLPPQTTHLAQTLGTRQLPHPKALHNLLVLLDISNLNT